MYCNTGSKGIVEHLSRLGNGILHTQTTFIQVVWAQWTDSQSAYIPSNIPKGGMVIHVFNSIDWENNNVERIETHHTNSILVCKNVIAQKIWQKSNTGLTKTSTNIWLV